MSNTHCTICNEPWDVYGLAHGDVAAWEADMIKEGKFRDNIDWTYNAKRHEIALTLSSTQILLARYADLMSQKATATQSNTEQPTTAQLNDLNKIVWDVIHQITDFIQGIKS